ncbi:hypothetical protein [Flammeovirga aprica]|uniref:Uncharacterized protein n=1 Tax=Flammeovirga aprica JL-4 TaxID=694437 RepID=A0A7X9RZS3_9BACT|nr:hypothetical protein [Flammeovirga aprica]NME71731.1 hypothetical protein [Flammeovirga aprica JL-4]
MKVVNNFFALTILILFCSQFSFSQTKAISETKKYTEKLVKKVKTGSLKKFAQYYPEACKDMEEIIKEASNSEFGYDKVADHIFTWGVIHNKLKKAFGEGPITSKKLSVPLNYVDYLSQRPEYQSKAAKAHYDFAEKIFNEEKDYDKRLDAVEHYEKARKYAPKQEKEQIYTKVIIDEKEDLIHYDEGCRIYDSASSFEEKVKSEAYFNKIALGKKKYEFRDVKNRISELYYTEGIRLNKSNEIDDLKMAAGHLEKVMDLDPQFKDVKDQYDKICQNIAAKYYSEGLKNQAIESYEGQETAAQNYKDCLTWVEGYKDASERMKTCSQRAKLRLVVLKPNSSFVYRPNTDWEVYVGDKLNKSIQVVNSPLIHNVSKLSELDINDTQSIQEANKVLGSNFLVLKLSNNPKVSVSEPQLTTKEEETFYGVINWIDEGEVKKEEYTNKKLYDTQVKAVDFMISMLPTEEERKAYKEKYPRSHCKGTLITHYYKLTAEAAFTVEVWDLRSGEPLKIGEKILTEKVGDEVSWETYQGDERAKPTHLKEKKLENLTTKEEMIKKVKAKVPSVQHFSGEAVEIINRNSAYKKTIVN